MSDAELLARIDALERDVRDKGERLARVEGAAGAVAESVERMLSGDKQDAGEMATLRAKLTRLEKLLDGPPSLDTRLAEINAAQAARPLAAMSRPGLDPTRPDPDAVEGYGRALGTWRARALWVAFGLVVLWKFATGDFIASVERLWWVVNPPPAVESVQDDEAAARDSTRTARDG